MTMKILRSIGAVAAGAGVVLVVVILVELFSTLTHPFPEGFEGTHEEVAQHVATYPDWILAIALLGWIVAAFAGTWVAGRLGNRGTAAFLGVFLLLAVIVNIVQLPYPLWFEIGAVLTIAAAAAGGYRLSIRGS